MDNPHPTVFAQLVVDAVHRGSTGRGLILFVGLLFLVPGLLAGSWFLILLGGAVVLVVLVWAARDVGEALPERRRRE